MKLYKITLKNYNNYYIIADNITSAYEKLKKIFKDNDLYFTYKETLKCAELIGNIFYEKNVFIENY